MKETFSTGYPQGVLNCSHHQCLEAQYCPSLGHCKVPVSHWSRNQYKAVRIVLHVMHSATNPSGLNRDTPNYTQNKILLAEPLKHSKNLNCLVPAFIGNYLGNLVFHFSNGKSFLLKPIYWASLWGRECGCEESLVSLIWPATHWNTEARDLQRSPGPAFYSKQDNPQLQIRSAAQPNLPHSPVMEKAPLSLGDTSQSCTWGTGIYFLGSTISHPNCNVWPWALVRYHLAPLAGVWLLY